MYRWFPFCIYRSLIVFWIAFNQIVIVWNHWGISKLLIENLRKYFGWDVGLGWLFLPHFLRIIISTYFMGCVYSKSWPDSCNHGVPDHLETPKVVKWTWKWKFMWKWYTIFLLKQEVRGPKKYKICMVQVAWKKKTELPTYMHAQCKLSEEKGKFGF